MMLKELLRIYLGMIRVPKITVIDTIPLLLFLIGTYNKNLILTFKRLKTYNYTFEDFKILREFLTRTKVIMVTPGVLSEVSKEVSKFGFTDTSLIVAAKNNGGEILTRDYALSQYCQDLIRMDPEKLK